MLIIKVYEHPGTVPRLYKVDQFPCRIGRSVMNSIPIENESISKEHAEIDVVGNSLVIRDLDSTNGIYQDGKRISNLNLVGNRVLFLGNIRIEVIQEEPQMEVTREIHLDHTIGFPGNMEREWPWEGKDLSMFLLVILGVLLVGAVDFYTDTYAETYWYKIPEAVGLLAMSGAFAFLVSVVSKIQTKKYHFLRFWFLWTAATVVFQFYELLSPLMEFNFFGDMGMKIIDVCFSVGIFFILFYLSAYLIFAHSTISRIRKVSAGAAVILVFGLTVLGQFDEWVNPTGYSYESVVSVPLLGPSTQVGTLDQIWNDLDKSLSEIKKARKKVLKERAER